MVVKEISDEREIKKILFDPEIYDRIKIGDSLPEIPFKNCRYIAGYHEGEIFGVMLYHKRKSYTTCHIHVLKKHRPKLAVKFGKEAIKMRCTDTLYTNIPSGFNDVARFARHFGFVFTGKFGEHNVYRADL